MGLMAHDAFDDDWDDDLGWIDVPARPESRAAAAQSDGSPRVRDEIAPDADVNSSPRVRDEFASDTDVNSTHTAGSTAAMRDGATDPDAPLELEDDDWQVAPPPVPARRATAGDDRARSGRRRRGPLGSPVVLLALYSAAGVALVVLAVNLLSGSFRGDDAPRTVPAADRQPLDEAAPAPTAVATATPVAEPAVSDFELRRREQAAAAARTAAIAAATRAEKAARAAERRRIVRERRQMVRERRERARARARAQARRRPASPPAAATAPPAEAPAAPPPPAPAPAPSGGGGGDTGCEFCIG
jgi:hypothetical protein